MIAMALLLGGCAGRFDVQGHRGNRGNVPPGNTIESLRSALELGVDTIEVDLQITADGEVVLGHDDDLHETGCVWAGQGSERTSLISQMSVAELALWDCHPELPGVQSPPLLAEALALDEKVAWNIEMKRGTTQDADVYVQAIIAYQRECGGCLRGRLTIQSFEWSAVKYVRERYGGELEFRAAVLDKQAEFQAIAEAREYAEIWSPRHDLVTRELVERVKGLDMRVIPWTVNDEGRMRELIEMGVDGIITDYPDVLLRLVGR
jgi:glycerophosphoryl diester phosphodiesterase